jgi:Tol biopolymer transport system component
MTSRAGIGIYMAVLLAVGVVEIGVLLNGGLIGFGDDEAPAGERIVVEASFGKNSSDLFLVDVDGGKRKQLTDDEQVDTFPVLSPDGSMVAFNRGTPDLDGNRTDEWGIYVINVDGTGLRQVADDGERPAWSPDSRQIAFQRDVGSPDGAILVVNVDGTGLRKLAHNGVSPAFSPDGAKVAFHRLEPGSLRTEIYVIDADGTGLRKLAIGGVSPAWSPDSRKIAYELMPDRGGGLELINIDGTGLRKVADDGEFPTWSPDSRRIAFDARDPDADQPAIYVMDTNGMKARKLRKDGTRPAWSPNGQRIVFFRASLASPREPELHVINTDGSGFRRLA